MDDQQRLRAWFAAACAAADPAAAVHRHLRATATSVSVGAHRCQLANSSRIVLVAAGKAAVPMARAAEDLLGDRIARGVVVAPHSAGGASLRSRLLRAAHPVPDTAGEHAAAAVLAAVADLTPDDLVIACWSGGASALLPAPRPGVSLADKQAVTRLLLASGANIGVMNAVRKHLSLLKGGQLARRAAPATVLCLAISDVPGDDLAVIGSGPFAPDPSTFADAEAALLRLGITEVLPAAVRQVIDDGVVGRTAETPKPGEACFARVQHQLVATNTDALESIMHCAAEAGWKPILHPGGLQGEARIAGRNFVRCALELRQTWPRCALIVGGETTVTLGASAGHGGRNQEFALAAALELAGQAMPITVLAAGTDGIDGPTDAAGAFADPTTCERARALGLDPDDHLARHDAYPLFDRLGDLLRTGPTGTNVMDVAVALIG